jgi:2-methyl-3-hydroxypyridine 5-carboxylic acid dioxygenase
VEHETEVRRKAGRRHAEIAGAGFGGLTAAIALARRGWSVRVHEKGV